MPNDFFFNASASLHLRRGVWAFWPSAAGVCPARWQAGHRKLPKNPRGTYRENFVFWRPSSKVAAKCSFVLPGAGPWHQPVRTLGVTAVVHRTMQTTLMLRILLHMQRGPSEEEHLLRRRGRATGRFKTCAGHGRRTSRSGPPRPCNMAAFVWNTIFTHAATQILSW